MKQTDRTDCAPQSHISAILADKREISKEVAKKFTKRFNVNPNLYFFNAGKQAVPHSRSQSQTVLRGAALEKAGLSREGFEEVLALLPEGFIDQVHLEVDAERLITAAFGSCGR